MKRQTIKNFVVSFTATTVVFTLASQVAIYMNAQANLETLKVSNLARVENAKNVLDVRFDRAVTELRTIANTPVVKQLVEDYSAVNRLHTQDLFLSFAREQKLFNQISYLDRSGQEIVRVDYDPQHSAHVIPEAELKIKNDHYFQDALALEEGYISLSPMVLDLDDEKKVGSPQSMIRLSTPAINEQGDVQGVVAINLRGKEILDRYKQVMGLNSNNRTMLIDQDANWLVAPNASLEFEKMKGHTGAFAQAHPDVWAEISKKAKGHFKTEEGLYTYNTLYPLNWVMLDNQLGVHDLSVQREQLNHHHYVLKIITFTPEDQLPSAMLTSNSSFFGMYVFALFFIFIGTAVLSYFVAIKQTLRRQLAFNSRQQREILNHLGEGVVVLDQQAKVIDANPEAERLLGRHRHEILGHDAQTLFFGQASHSEDESRIQDQTVSPILSLPHIGQTYRNEEEVIYLKDGRSLVVGVVAAPLTTEDEVVGSMISFRDMTEIKAYQDQIYQLAYHDILTHLPNRRLLNDHIHLAFNMAQRHQRKFALMFIDLDKFKTVNDVYGHDVGDELLKWVAQKLLQSVRKVDTVSRLGGDEFVILLSEIHSVEDVIPIAKKIIREFSREPVNIMGHLLDIQISLGVAVYPEHGQEIEKLMQAADYAMYMAKRSGSNLYCMFGVDPQPI